MHQGFVERHSYSGGPLHRWDGRLKTILLLTYLVALAILPRDGGGLLWTRYGLLALLPLLLLIAGGLPLFSVLGRTLCVLPFAGFVALAQLLTHPGDTPTWGVTLHFTPDALERAGAILACAWMSILATFVLILTTPFPSLLAALESFRFPSALVRVIGLVYRYLWLLREQATRLLCARRLRTFRRSTRVERRSGTAIVATLFVRTLARAERAEQAMALRGFRGRFLRGSRERWEMADTVRLAVGLTAILGASLLPAWVSPP